MIVHINCYLLLVVDEVKHILFKTKKCLPTKYELKPWTTPFVSQLMH